jgi:hypothetical protein
VYRRAAPLAIAIIANVAIKGGVLNLVTIKPFNILQPTPASIATANASVKEPVCVYVDTERTPANANTEAEDKSNIPDMIRIVCPNANMVPTDICVEIFCKFPTETKFSFANQQKINNATRTK